MLHSFFARLLRARAIWPIWGGITLDIVSTDLCGVAIVRYLLAHHAPLLDMVPSTSIVSGDIPIDTALPAIGVRQISGWAHKTISMDSAATRWRDRVQVSVLADNYPEKKAILAMVDQALPLSRGIINGVYCDSIRKDISGPDLDDIETGIFEQGQDFMVYYDI